MQNLEDLKEKIFFEAKNILENLAKISNTEELLRRKDMVEELNERISFLKILKKNEDILVSAQPLEVVENQQLNSESHNEILPTEDNEILEEEVLFTNELNEEIHKEDEEIEIFEFAKNDEPEVEISEVIENDLEEEIPSTAEEELILESNTETSEEEHQRLIEEKEKAFQELEERRRKIVEFQKPEVPLVPDISEEEKPHYLKHPETSEASKKFKLAHIKGLKSVQSLFDEDPLEKIQEEEHFEEKTVAEQYTEKEITENSSLQKSNMPTDFMEAEKQKQEFRLDLNDKIAFSKMLFNGSQTDMNEAVRKLNEFKNMEDAKEFLSDLYYERDWKNADEYAQRLWSLVENKFQ